MFLLSLLTAVIASIVSLTEGQNVLFYREQPSFQRANVEVDGYVEIPDGDQPLILQGRDGVKISPRVGIVSPESSFGVEQAEPRLNFPSLVIPTFFPRLSFTQTMLVTMTSTSLILSTCLTPPPNTAALAACPARRRRDLEEKEDADILHQLFNPPQIDDSFSVASEDETGGTELRQAVPDVIVAKTILETTTLRAAVTATVTVSCIPKYLATLTTCAGCTSNDECPLVARKCEAKVCKPCGEAADCPAWSPICTAGVCGKCSTAAANCPTATPVCTSKGSCVKCDAANICPNGETCNADGTCAQTEPE